MYSGFCLFGWTEWCLCNAFNIPHLPRRKKHLPNQPKKSTNVTMSQCHLSLGQCLFGSGSEPSLERWAHPCSDRPDGKALQRAHMHGSGKSLTWKNLCGIVWTLPRAGASSGCRTRRKFFRIHVEYRILNPKCLSCWSIEHNRTNGNTTGLHQDARETLH